VLFDEKHRVFQGPKSYTESDWEYLDRSARIEIQRVRAFLEHWTAQYPAQHRDELVSRLKRNEDASFRSATFEIILFAILRSIGCSITVHPDLDNQAGTHPDFLVVTQEGERAYVEAVLASEEGRSGLSARRRVDVVLNEIEKVDSPNFFLFVKWRGNPSKPLSCRNLRSELEQWLSSLDPDVVAQQVDVRGSDAMPMMEWKDAGWRIHFYARPKKPEERGKGQRVIVGWSSGLRLVKSWVPIRDAIKAKGAHYGELGSALIVAVNIDDPFVDRIDEMQGLFGEEEWTLGVGDPSYPDMSRKRNGAWQGPSGPQYTRVSGAWIFANLDICNLASCGNTLYINPWGTKAIPGAFKEFSCAMPEGDGMRWTDEKPLGQILGLSAGWPR
jgi:hypothetical protein